MTKITYLSFGYLTLVLAFIGILLPVVPSTPFVLLAFYCFSKSSPKMRARLENSKLFGSTIRNWQAQGAISIKAKIVAALFMTTSATMIYFADLGTLPSTITYCFLGASLAFVLSRPNPSSKLIGGERGI